MSHQMWDLAQKFMEDNWGVQFVDVTVRCECSEPAKWQNDPCNNANHINCTSHIYWCDTCVPLCAECNESEPDKAKWKPCVEISPFSQLPIK